jgi:selenide,water dikinase
VYRIAPDKALILTADFFTPVVDDPCDYGAVAAANAMSDVYAMGGDVLMALNLCAFPTDFPDDIITSILRGGAEKVREAGGVLAGGHTVNDEEPKYGLAVLGIVHPDRVFTKTGARPGDIVFLTKPLGSGIVTTAAKFEAAREAHISAATLVMKTLNREACGVFRKAGIRGCTDITGFSLLGHGMELAEKSGVLLSLRREAIPFLDGAMDYAEEGLFPGGAIRNREFYGKNVIFNEEIPEKVRGLLFTPETSGGLLAAVPQEAAGAVRAGLAAAGVSFAEIGRVEAGAGIMVL